MKLHQIRDDYQKDALLRVTLEPNPILQFEKWFSEAVSKGCDKPNAMVISTVSADGQPRGRVVLLKETTKNGFVFFTNYNSIKGEQIQANSKASFCFYWTELERQVIVEGTLSKLNRIQNEAYFRSRPFDSQINAVISAQSQLVATRLSLLQAAEELKHTLTEGELPECPQEWGGYILIPQRVEFWQGRPDRLHDRFIYTPSGSSWTTDRVAP